MFDAIARRYDLANTILSAGLHHRWKHRAVAAARLRPGERVLDIGAGTGDLSLLAAGAGCRVVAVDLSPEMLSVAARKLAPSLEVAFVRGDIERLPFHSETFDAVITGFTLRHPTDLPAALREVHRVLVAGGRLVVLEFSRPASRVVRWVYDACSFGLIPSLGGWLTGDREAYVYLVESIRRFPAPDALSALLAEAGFTGVSSEHLSGGIVALHMGIKS